MRRIALTVNGVRREAEVEPRLLLVYFLREHLALTGTNVALDDLPGWMAAIGRCLPLSHAIEATRLLGDGASWSSVQGLVGTELAIGLVYVVIGLGSLRLFEHLSRTGATLDKI